MHVDVIKDNLCVRYLSIVNLCTCGAGLDLLRSAYLLYNNSIHIQTKYHQKRPKLFYSLFSLPKVRSLGNKKVV